MSRLKKSAVVCNVDMSQEDKTETWALLKHKVEYIVFHSLISLKMENNIPKKIYF